MVRISADILAGCGQFTNALKDREIDIRGYKIGVIENLGSTLDQFDVMDFTDNDIRRIDSKGFPQLKRLKTLLLSGNRVVKISKGLEGAIGGLEEINLTNNRVAELADLTPLKTLPNLARLSLIGNPVARVKQYRSFVIKVLPNIKILDFHKVNDAERKAADDLFSGAEGEALLAKLSKSSAPAAGAGGGGSKGSGGGAKGAAVSAKAAEERKKILEAIKNATTVEEMQAAEQMLKDSAAMET
eukprot:gene6778-7688_t